MFTLTCTCIFMYICWQVHVRIIIQNCELLDKMPFRGYVYHVKNDGGREGKGERERWRESLKTILLSLSLSLSRDCLSFCQILEIPSKLFYKNRLTCRAKFPLNGPHNIPPLKFIGVDGQELQDDDSPSYYNDLEAFKITEQVS